MARAVNLLIASVVIAASSGLYTTSAFADHKGHWSAHVAAEVELGPRLSSRLQTSIPESSQPHAERREGAASAQAEVPQSSPKRNVRVVYPGPFKN